MFVISDETNKSLHWAVNSAFMKESTAFWITFVGTDGSF